MDLASLIAAPDAANAFVSASTPVGSEAAVKIDPQGFTGVPPGGWAHNAEQVALSHASGFLSTVKNAEASAVESIQSIGQKVAGPAGASAAVPVVLALVAAGIFFAVQAARGKKSFSVARMGGSHGFKF